eukprot:245387-Chlamydomonas_euryale.AAC.1
MHPGTHVYRLYATLHGRALLPRPAHACVPAPVRGRAGAEAPLAAAVPPAGPPRRPTTPLPSSSTDPLARLGMGPADAPESGRGAA